jgi:putative transposase
MVHYRRNFVAGGTYFFTATLADRRSSVLTDRVADLRAAITQVRRQHPFVVDAIVVLPDHLHVVMTLPDGDADFPTRWQLIKRRFTGAVAKAGHPIARHRNGELALWQRRFWEHTIRDEADFERHVDYIHFNPVKHGLVARVRDWPHSSFRRYVRRGILPADWGGDLGEIRGGFGEREP